MRRAIDRKCRIIMPLRTPFTGVIALFALNQHGTCALAWKLTARVPWLGSSLGGWRLCRSRTCSVAPQERCRPWRARTPRSYGLACLLAAREEDVRCVCVGGNAVMPQPSRRPTMQGTAPPAFDRQRVADRAAGCAGSIGWGTSATTLSGRISSITNDFL